MNLRDQLTLTEATEIASELGITPQNWEDEEILTPNARVSEQEYFGILDRQIVSQDGDVEKRRLKFYDGDDPKSETTVELARLKTSQSKNDDTLKWSLVRFCFYLIFAAMASFGVFDISKIAAGFVLQFIEDTGRDPVQAPLEIMFSFIFWLLIGAGLGIRFTLLSTRVFTNFMAVDRLWQLSISGFLQQLPSKKMQSVRLCMLTFRQFIKWRRFTNFFFGMFWLFAIPFMVSSFAVVYYFGSIHPIEVVFFLLFFGALLFVLRWFKGTVELHTKWRDPTVQLCVMVAELHSRFVNKRNL